MEILPLFKQALENPSATAVVDDAGAFTYATLWQTSGAVAAALLDGRSDLGEARIAFLVPSQFAYPAVQWGIWRAGGIAVPLCTSHPLPELEYALTESGCEAVVVAPEFEEKIDPLIDKLELRKIRTADAFAAQAGALPEIDPDRRAMILFTSGTTSRPKGVVSTHKNIWAQVSSLRTAWAWRSSDHILHVLPLHHTHGIINVLSCALASGATCEFLPKFDAEAVWQKFVERPLTLFMAVPTIYNRLIAAFESAGAETKIRWHEACKKFRLMVSGSAALPVSVLEKWQKMTGQRLLERYGMTEIGMALSNPYVGERRAGQVGVPLPHVQVRLGDESGAPIEGDGPGEIQVKGANVFREYWNRPEATAASFTEDGWFRTGDRAEILDGYYKILGRNSVDIIKSGGYKISALEIEEVLRTHPAVLECAVVGVADPEWGERVAAALVLNAGQKLDLQNLRSWAKEKLAIYKTPSLLKCVADLPRNVMGKVTKPEVKKLF